MIKGKKYGLRAVEENDIEKLKDWRNLPEFRRNFREVRELSLADQKAWLKSVNQSKQNNFMFSIVNLDNGEVIGAAGLLYINWIIRSADFSFYIGKDKEYIDDKGIAFEVANLLIKYGFENLNLNKIWMELYEFDSKKISFFKKLNFKTDGCLRDNCFEDGKFYNSFIISLLKDDYEQI